MERQADRAARVAAGDPLSEGRTAGAKAAQSRLNAANNYNTATNLGVQESVENSLQNTSDKIRSVTSGSPSGSFNIPHNTIARDNTRIASPYRR